jgi:hypothetical protein
MATQDAQTDPNSVGIPSAAMSAVGIWTMHVVSKGACAPISFASNNQQLDARTGR